jgi:energy-coupling factor transporter ATP-binding protein EcfA2
MKMPMQGLSLNGFRGATNPVEFSFEDKPVVMIFGENGTGKSTVVDAIDFVCNEKAGQLDGRQSTPVKDYLPALGCKAGDLKVELKWATKTWTATLSSGKPKATGSKPRPLAKILRRSQILEIVDAQPAKRYEAFSRFLAVPNVEQSENALREAHRTVSEEFNSSTQSYEEAVAALTKLKTEAVTTEPDLYIWAKSKNETDASEYTARSEHISGLRSLVQSGKNALSDLNIIQARAEAEGASVQAFTIDLQAAEEASSEANSDLLKLLDAAEEFLTLQKDQENCPVCEQGIDRSLLLARLSSRKSAGEAVVKASRKLDAATKQRENSQTLVTDKQTRFLSAAVKLLKGFQGSKLSSIVNRSIEWATFTFLGDIPAEHQIPQALIQARNLLATCEQCEGPLPTEQTTIASELGDLRAIKVQYAAVVKHQKKVKALEALTKRLAAVLKIVESERKTYVDNALDLISDRVCVLYGKLHPGEKLGNIKLQLDPDRRRSLNVSSRFESKDDVPPQGYYSEAHLDTLGICIFLALAEKDATSDTLLVLDDVLTSADQAHIDRFIEMVHEELKHPLLITTHYRPWRDRYRFAKGPALQVQLIELLPWSQQRGVRHTKTKLEADDLKEALAKEPIDRQGVASKAGVLLEAVLGHVCFLYECKLPCKVSGNHTLGDYLSGIDSKLRKLLKSVTTSQDKKSGQQTETTMEIKPLLDAIDSTTWIRNLVGAHFNMQGMDVSDAQVIQFGKATGMLLEAVICPGCGELPRKNTGSCYSCGCKTRQLHPLTSPTAQPPQSGN